MNHPLRRAWSALAAWWRGWPHLGGEDEEAW